MAPHQEILTDGSDRNMKDGAFLIFYSLIRLQRISSLLERQSTISTLVTELSVFRYDREFSTITRFLPGLIKAAFQNYVPKSIPNTCV